MPYASMTTATPPTWANSTNLGPGPLALAVFTAATSSSGVLGSPVLVGVADGQRSYIVPLDQFGQFVSLHAAGCLVCHNAGDLHRSLHDYLHITGDYAAISALWKFVAAGRFHDVELLDQLIALAQDGSSHPPRRSLDQLAGEKAVGVKLLDADGVRELVSSAMQSGDQAYQALAAELAARSEALLLVFNAQLQQMRAAGLAFPDSEVQRRFGPLSLAIQVQADVALAYARSNGLSMAPEAMGKIKAECLTARSRSEDILAADREARQCFHWRPGDKIQFKPNGLPAVKPKTLEAWMGREFASIKGLYSSEFTLPLGAGGRLNTTPERWELLARCRPGLGSWYEMMVAPSVLRACGAAATSPLRPHYEILPRIQSGEPDLKELLRLCGPDLFRPNPGRRLLVVELQHLELRALAAVCQRRFGASKLADVFNARKDPYEYVAKSLERQGPATFPGFKTDKTGAHEWHLKLARALLAVAPMGLDMDALVQVAHKEFGLPEIQRAHMQQLHRILLKNVLPELKQYLREDTVEVMAANLKADPNQLRDAMKALFPGNELRLPTFRDWIRGDKPLKRYMREKLQIFLKVHNANGVLIPLLSSPMFGAKSCRSRLYTALFGRRVTTLTGRGRGGMLFAEAREVEYLDLADDALKAALFALAAVDIKPAAVVNSFVVAEVADDEQVDAVATQAEGAARRAAEDVLGCVPASCAVQVMETW